MVLQMDDLHYMQLHELAALIRAGQISSQEVTQAILKRIAGIDNILQSYVLVMGETAIAEAKQRDAELAAGFYRGPLHGVPIGIKDLCWVKDFPTAAGMPLHKGFIPAKDATVVSRLRNAGAVVLGKLQLTEGAYSDHHPEMMTPSNPWWAEYWTGISSSGSGVAVAAGLCYGAIGTDTGGSIRWPSAANGITGFKPGWGRVSRHGVFALAPSLDHVGVMARSTIDTAYMLWAIAGSDELDPTAVQALVPDYLSNICEEIRGLRIGFDPAWNTKNVDEEVQHATTEALEVLKGLGAKIVELSFPDTTDVIADWALNCAVEAAVAHEKTYPRYREHYGEVLSSVIENGLNLSGVDFQRILLRRAEFCGRWNETMQSIDLALMPVQPFAPLTLDRIKILGTQPELIAQLQRFTCPFNMTGSPSLTLPAGFSATGLPIGVQLVSGMLCEDVLFKVGAAFQRATDWHHQHPEI